MTNNKKHKLALAAIKHYADLIDIWLQDPKCDSNLMVIKYGTDFGSSFCPYCRQFSRVIPSRVDIGLKINFPLGYFRPKKWYKYKISRDILHAYVFMKYVIYFIRYPKSRHVDFHEWISYHRGVYKMNCGRCPLNPHSSRDPFFCCNGLWMSMRQNSEKIPYSTEIIKYICDHALSIPFPSETRKTAIDGEQELGFFESLKRDRYGRSYD